MTAQELKNSILQYAVQGKLVPQDPNDETAAVLLQKIKAEKQRLIKEKKIKAEKPLPPITEEEIPFEIPESWKWVRLGDIGSWGSGATPSKANSKYYSDGNIPWLKTGDLNDGLITVIPDKITDLALQETSVKINQIGSVLIAMYGATIGKLGILQLEATTNQACCACQPFSQIFNWYLFFYLLSQKENLKSKSEGGAQPNISKEKILSYPFPLPPLSEQQRIVAKIEELMPFVEEYDKAEKELTGLNTRFPEQIKKSVLQYAIQGKLVPAPSPLERAGGEVYEPASELLKRIKAEKKQLIKDKKIKAEKPLPPITEEEIPFEIPESWEWVRLGEVCNFGKNESVLSNKIKEKDWLLELEDIEKDTGRIIDIKLKKERNSVSNKNVFKKGNVLYSKLRPYLNKVVVVDKDGYCSSEIFPLDFGTHIYNKFAQLYLMSPYFVEFATQKSYGTKMPRFGSTDGQNALFALPPLSEQQRIVEKVEEVLGVCEGLK